MFFKTVIIFIDSLYTHEYYTIDILVLIIEYVQNGASYMGHFGFVKCTYEYETVGFKRCSLYRISIQFILGYIINCVA